MALRSMKRGMIKLAPKDRDSDRNHSFVLFIISQNLKFPGDPNKIPGVRLRLAERGFSKEINVKAPRQEGHIYISSQV
jgi:hypothetical protein